MPSSIRSYDLPLRSGGSLFVSEAGSGPVILCGHGFPLDHGMWRGQLDGLSGHYRVIAPDLRGFGRSAGSPPVESLDGFVDDLCDLLDGLQIEEPVVFCGLSMGGYIAFRFAILAASRLRGMILCDTRAAADTPEVVANRHRMVDLVGRGAAATVVDAMHAKLFASTTFEQQPELTEDTLRVMLSTAPATIIAALLAMASRPDATPMLPDLPVPSLWICGSEDEITPAEEMRASAAMTPGSRCVEIPAAGHMAPLEQTSATNAAIVDFMRCLSTASGATP
jgi:3-oxoadipate enol-lactonase